MEGGAGTVNPNQVLLSAQSPLKGCPLLGLSDLLIDVEGFLKYAENVAIEKGVTMMSLKIFPRRLKKARTLWWKKRPRRSASAI